MKIVIIGGGASGLVTSIIAAKNKNNDVYIIEQNDSCGKKILRTGNGRCNYFNENNSLFNYHSSFEDGIEKIITKENLEEVLLFFDKLGIMPKIKNGYYYPLSNQASSVKEILLKTAISEGVNIITDLTVTNLEKTNQEKFIIYTTKDKIVADKVVMAMGSFAGIKENQKHQGYNILQKLGHHIETVLPSLVQLKGKESYFKKWNGVRCDCLLTLKENNKIIKKEAGEIQLTDYGISGICTFNISGIVSRGLFSNKEEIVEIDFLPSISNDIDCFIKYLNNRKKMLNISVKDFLIGLLNNKLIDVILEKSNINLDTNINDLSDREIEILATNIKSFRLPIVGTNSFDSAQVCSGGVSLKEINLETMESIICSNLYVVGELLDLDGICGGYNLTIAWISGLLAGSDLCD